MFAGISNALVRRLTISFLAVAISGTTLHACTSSSAAKKADEIEARADAIDDDEESEGEGPTELVDDVAVGALTSDGLHFAVSRKDFETTWSDLIAALESNDQISIVKQLDYAAEGEAIGRRSSPTRVVLFGNPALGTPLMQEERTAGLDLPRRVVVFGSADGVMLAYDSGAYLAARHDVGDVETLQKMSKALDELGAKVTGEIVNVTAVTGIRKKDGVEIKESEFDFETTYARLESAIETNPRVHVVFELDHAANAKKAGMELLPTRVIALEDTETSVNWTDATGASALDLPHRMLVWQQKDGDVKVAFNDPLYVSRRHRLKGVEKDVEAWTVLLKSLVEVATDDDPDQTPVQ